MDLWSAGAIIGELYTFSPLFPGQNDIEQLWCVIRVLGTPTEETWPQLSTLPDYEKITFSYAERREFDQVWLDLPEQVISLLKDLLVYDS